MANCSVIILAAGKGTRMRSATPKVLHGIAGRSMLGHVMQAVDALEPYNVVLVLAPGMEAVEAEARRHIPGCRVAVQKEQLGTGHAVRCGLEALEDAAQTVLVVYGDTPLMLPQTLHTIVEEKQQALATISLAAIHLEDPTGYGRLVMPSQPHVERIVECRDATPGQKKIQWVWGGIMAFETAFLRASLKELKPSAATGEYYLTALLEMASAQSLKSLMVPMPAEEAMGVNDRAQLAAAEAVMQRRLRQKVMEDGVTLTAPETVFLQADTRFGQDVIVQPHVVFGAGVVVGNNVEIRAFSHVDGSVIGDNSVVGPYARLRPGTQLGSGVRIGNFVELKQTTIAAGSKINHLSYVGDSEVGEDVNIGAGTITCNYDGIRKSRTVIKSGAFIGSNCALVAPVTIGMDALIGAGSVITDNVPDDALAFERSTQIIKPNRGRKKTAEA